MTAAEAYRARVADVRAAMGRLDDALTRHAERQADSPEDWGWVGDVGAVEARLSDLATRLLLRDALADYAAHTPEAPR